MRVRVALLQLLAQRAEQLQRDARTRRRSTARARAGSCARARGSRPPVETAIARSPRRMIEGRMKLHRCVTSTTLQSIWRAPRPRRPARSCRCRSVAAITRKQPSRSLALVGAQLELDPSLLRPAAHLLGRLERDDAHARAGVQQASDLSLADLARADDERRAPGQVEDRRVVGSRLPAPAALAPARRAGLATLRSTVARCVISSPSLAPLVALGELGERPAARARSAGASRP